MELTPEKLAFIRATEPLQDSSPQEEPQSNAKPALTLPEDQQPIKRVVPPRGARRQREPAVISESQAASMLPGLLVPLTTRLQPKTADALRRAYLEQKLRRRAPDTQQEIVEAALVDWLRRHGYLA
jgi:hypothetical protein